MNHIGKFFLPLSLATFVYSDSLTSFLCLYVSVRTDAIALHHHEKIVPNSKRSFPPALKTVQQLTAQV